MLMQFIKTVLSANKLRDVTDAEPLPTNTLGRPQPGLGLSINGVGASARAQLGAATTRVSLLNTTNALATFRLGDVTVAATSTDDALGPLERIDISVRPGEYIAVLGGLVKVSQLGA